jgi:hypothetical protein
VSLLEGDVEVAHTWAYFPGTQFKKTRVMDTFFTRITTEVNFIAFKSRLNPE